MRPLRAWFSLALLCAAAPTSGAYAHGILKLAGRSFKLYNGSGSPLHLLVDVNGYFAVSP